ncbi:MAG: ArsR family transcriptional regulator [Desulfurococcales archaeon]|nr:ArsR family transcriptional regulator [Desulfurococcales archaeon]
MEEDLDFYEERGETGTTESAFKGIPSKRMRSRPRLEIDKEALAKDMIRKSGRWLLILSVLDEPTRVTDIVNETGLPRSTVSRILKIMREKELVAAYRGIDGRNVYYKLSKVGSDVYREVSRIIKGRLKKCIRDNETRELDLECTARVLSRITRDVKVHSAILKIVDVKRKGEILILGY